VNKHAKYLGQKLLTGQTHRHI